MPQKRIKPGRADRIKTLTICRLLLISYHYKLQVTSNGQIHRGFPFTFGAPPKHLTRVIFNPKLTKVHCKIMSAGHKYQGNDYKGVRACLHCNINKTTTWTNAKEHKATFENIWLTPSFASQEKQAAKSKERTGTMIAFLDKAGKWTGEKSQCGKTTGASKKQPLE